MPNTSNDFTEKGTGIRFYAPFLCKTTTPRGLRVERQFDTYPAALSDAITFSRRHPDGSWWIYDAHAELIAAGGDA